MLSSPKKDPRYFISRTQYNCPFCSTSAVRYQVLDYDDFHWSNDREVRCIRIQCQEPSCLKISLHMTNYKVSDHNGDLYLPSVEKVDEQTGEKKGVRWESVHEIDDVFFYHQPNSSFVIDDRIPEKIRESLDQASTCHKMSLHIGASASLRKAIFELLSHFNIPKTRAKNENDKKIIEKIPYFERLDSLQEEVLKQYPHVERELLSDIKKVYSLVSNPLHERLPDEVEWEDFTNPQFLFLLSVVHNLLLQIFVEPEERKERGSVLTELAKKVSGLRGETS